jgi:hypothetical protein
MNNYIDKIHEIIEKVNPQLYVDLSNSTLMTYLVMAGIIFGIGILLSMLFKIFPKFKTLTGDFGDDSKAFFFGVPVILVILVVMSYRSPIKNTLNSDSKSLVSEYVGTLSNDEYIDMEKQVRAYSHQVLLDSELDRAVNNYLMEILDK